MELGETLRDQENECPYCHTKHDALTSLRNTDSSGPSPGSFTICFNCTEIAVFTDDMKQRPVTAEDYEQLDNDQLMELQKARALLILRNAERQAQLEKMVSEALGLPKRKIKFGGVIIVKPPGV